MTAFDPSRMELVDLLSSATLLADRPMPQEARQRPQTPAKPDGDRPLKDRVADAKAALYGDRGKAKRRAAEVREQMVRSGRV